MTLTFQTNNIDSSDQLKLSNACAETELDPDHPVDVILISLLFDFLKTSELASFRILDIQEFRFWSRFRAPFPHSVLRRPFHIIELHIAAKILGREN